MHVCVARIKQCTEISSEYVMTTHHEMGHVQYYMNYRRQPIIYRHGANPGILSHQCGNIQTT